MSFTTERFIRLLASHLGEKKLPAVVGFVANEGTRFPNRLRDLYGFDTSFPLKLMLLVERFTKADLVKIACLTKKESEDLYKFLQPVYREFLLLSKKSILLL